MARIGYHPEPYEWNNYWLSPLTALRLLFKRLRHGIDDDE